MLLFPKLHIRDEQCVFPESANLRRLHKDPIEMVRMLRVMNVRSILLVDDLRAEQGVAVDWQLISDIASNVDIPIQLEAGEIDSEFVARALDVGVYRCIVPVGCELDASTACSLISEFGAQHLTVRFPSTICLDNQDSKNLTITGLVSTLGNSACSRLILTLDDRVSWRSGDNLEQKLRAVSAGNSGRRLRITIDGGVLDADDLLSLNQIAPRMVDSVAVFEPFFASRFPCQAFWCWNEKEAMDLSRFSSATLKC